MSENLPKRDSKETRFFMIEVICEQCNKSHRIEDLNEDYLGGLHCTYCSCRDFQIKKRKVTEQSFHLLGGKNKIIQSTIRREYQK